LFLHNKTKFSKWWWGCHAVCFSKCTVLPWRWNQ